MNIFGFSINKASKKTQDPSQNGLPIAPSFVPTPDEVGAINIPYGGSQSVLYDLGYGGINNETDLISKYRDLALQPEVENAIDDITNQAIIMDDKNKGVMSLNLDQLLVDDKFKYMIKGAFEKVIQLLRLNVRGYDVFRQWYVDGKKAYHIIINEAEPQAGILELREIDGIKIRKVNEVGQGKDEDGHDVQEIINSYFVYSENGFNINANNTNYNNTASLQVIKIAEQSILYVTSGLRDEASGMPLSFLHSALRPLRMLRNMEDAGLVYSLARAPQRRVFRPDVSGLPPAKADQYVQRMMAANKSSIKYNQSTGEIRDDRAWLSMTDDYWFPQKDGRGTTVDVLNGDKSFLEPDWLNIFENKLDMALKVPSSRKAPNATFMFGGGAEITRDELKFMKFVNRLRIQFSKLVLNAMKTELLLTQVVNEDEWTQIEPFILFDFTEDSYFQEMKDQEVIRQKAGTTQAIAEYINVLFDKNWVYKNIWNMHDEEVEQMTQSIMDAIAEMPPPTE